MDDIRKIEPYLLRGMPELARAIDQCMPGKESTWVADSMRNLARTGREREALCVAKGWEAEAVAARKAAVILDCLADQVEQGAALRSQRQTQEIERYEAEIGDTSGPDLT